MINVSLQVRRAVIEDHLQIASLIHNEVASHRHLDWRVPLEWIGSPNYWVLEDGGRITAALACPEDPPRVFVHLPKKLAKVALLSMQTCSRSRITPFVNGSLGSGILS